MAAMSPSVAAGERAPSNSKFISTASKPARAASSKHSWSDIFLGYGNAHRLIDFFIGRRPLPERAGAPHSTAGIPGLFGDGNPDITVPYSLRFRPLPGGQTLRAAFEMNDATVDETRFLRQQKTHGLGHIHGMSHPPNRNF